MNEEKSTHPGILFQFRALWPKGMTVETVQDLILRLNDFIVLGEETITRKGGVIQ
jgi:hypothetical protein